ncbi:MAG: GNAT family N-acetyltransferase [Clostridia bacterium]|nr:GNAT family N-acetyltransferase [Clostridia bacterium]
MVRFAGLKDAEKINVLRKEVNDLHVAGRPSHFKAGFNKELRDHVFPYLAGGFGYAAVDETDGQVIGMVMVDYIDRPESPYRYAERFCHIAEICVDENRRGQGVGKRLMDFVKADAKAKGFSRIELDVWAFNDALGFYEAEGFTIFRRYLECYLDK